ncbi:MAG: hypothetical protein HZC41_06190 [Chloroflexi bacterium]|nr:hypothetical protein [Chloroflexota bacterium]
MADSLFDNRYRYDYIYPRGRSGETLRAVDTQDRDRPVVIKRPAPNDAPPIRAGQEVSILNERKALMRLAGHPVATTLLGGGQFLVGGTAHQYIVMERGQGMIVADLVRELAQRGERMPELELLVIADNLLDLLQAAHTRDIVYNDVDAKHLFWDRDSYRLKVIDWGNAVFLEGDDVTPQGISRQSDVFQVGELLYFILTGGSRPEIPRDAGEDFSLDFGMDEERVPPRLQAIVSKAAHPNVRYRYKTIAELRKALADYRDPLERERNAILGRVSDRLRHNRSKDELNGLLETLQPALALDPGFPPARVAYSEILARLHDLEVAADLDAVRIYMDSANWGRAVGLLSELRERARAEMRALIDLLLDLATLLHQPPPGVEGARNASPVVLDAIALVFERENARAAHLLMVSDDDYSRPLQWLLAERIAAHTPDLLLLRPNLYRLQTALASLAAEGLPVTEARAVLNEVDARLERVSTPNTSSLIELRDGCRAIVDALTALGTILEKTNERFNLPESRLPVSALDRALNAAMALADNMHVIGRQATASPRDAMNALDSSRAIDPMNPAWDAVARMLNGLYELLGSYQTYVPAADGSDLEIWLVESRRDLLPFTERLFDEMLIGMVTGLEDGVQAWRRYADDTVQGDRYGAITALAEATDAVATISPTLAGWLNQLRTVVTNAAYVERHTLYGGLGRALADGWEAFDRGRLQDAERLGQQAVEIARTDPQRFAAQRLSRLTEVARGWMERSGVQNVKGTQAALATIEGLYTEPENTLRENFSSQMPSKETYLRAMSKGLVDLYARSSSAALRLLFVHYILLGTLDAHDGNLDDADFWLQAAVKTMAELGQRHPLTRALDEFISRRRDLLEAAAVLNRVNGSHALPLLANTRKALEDNPQAKVLAAGIHSIRELEAALRDWSDGEFRPAGIKLDNVLNAINEVEQAASITLTEYRAWMMELQAAAAELHVLARQMQQVIDQRPDKPVDTIRVALRRMVEVTTRLLGEAYAATVRGWRDTYESFLSVYADNTIRRSEKLNRFNQLFRAMFIDRHPAYPLYRHWYDLTEHAPEFPAPPTDEPTPRLAEDVDVPETDYRGSRYADDAPERGRGRLRLPLLAVIAAAVVLLALAGLAASGALNGGAPGVVLTLTDTPDSNTQTVGAQGVAPLQATSTYTPAPTDTLDPGRVTPTLLPMDLITPTLRPSQPVPELLATLPAPTTTWTPSPTSTPTLTYTPSATYTATSTPTATNTPTATLPPQGLQGQQDVLALLERLPDYPWSADDFSLVQTIGSAYWRLGSGEPGEDDAVTVRLPADVLNTFYGNNAAARLTRMEVELTLLSFNPQLLQTEPVYFGALLQNADNPAQSAGLHVQMAQPGVINLGQRIGTDVSTVSQRAVSVVVARIRLDRSPDTGSVTVFFDGEQIGPAIPFTRPDAPLLPTLYVKSGGVIVSVTGWKISLR